jgi:chromate transporter
MRATSAMLAAMVRPRLSDIALLFLRIANTTFGGGDPTMAALQREFDRRHWIDADQFSIAFGLARITPGTNMVAFCAATGWYLRGMAGAITAVLAVTLPSAALVVWLTHICEIGNTSPLARSVIGAAVAAAVGTMIAAAGRLAGSQCSRADWLRPVALTAGAFLLSRSLGLSPLQVIGIAALAGFVWVPKSPSESRSR